MNFSFIVGHPLRVIIYKNATWKLIIWLPTTTNKQRDEKQKQGSGGVCKKGVLRNFAKFTGKHLCQRLFFNKVAGLRPATLLKKSLWHRYFPVNFAKFLRTPFLTNTSDGCFWKKWKIVSKQPNNQRMLHQNLLTKWLWPKN